jgi:hypothetical protein
MKDLDKNGFSYLLDNIQLNTGQTLTYSYNLTYSETPTQTISLEDIDGEKYGDTHKSIKTDGLLDIKLQPENGCIKMMKTFINTNNPQQQKREYTIKDINLQELIDDYNYKVENQTKEAMDDLSKIANIVNDPDRNKNIENLPGLSSPNIPVRDLLSQAFNGGLNLDLGFFDKQLDQLQQGLDQVAGALCKGFSFGGNNTCKGLPIPFNQAFLAPGEYHLFGCIPLTPLTESIGKGIPILSFPGLFQAGPVPAPLPQFF